MPSITVPKEFFVKERRMYSYWQQAFWREFFQNSVDAGSTKIDVRLSVNSNYAVEVVFTDNGCGMDRDTLERVYFRLGASTKSGADMVGGFGRARILTCFSMDSYRIHTRDNLVIGDGGEYTIVAAEYRAGTEVRVAIADETVAELKSVLKEYLRYSQLRCDVTIDGVPHTDWTHRRELSRTLEHNDIEFANVHVNKSVKNNLVIVRVSGAMMFYKYVNMNAQVIVEIAPEHSRKVLMANRDAFQYEYMAILDKFIAELSTETMSALQPKFKRKSATFKGAGLFVNFGKKAVETMNRSSNVAESQTEQKATEAETINVIPSGRLATETVSQALNRLDIAKITTSLSDGGRYLPNLPNIYLLDEAEAPAIRRVIDQYEPNNWVTVYHRGKPTNRGSTIYKVLMMWKVACDVAVEAMLKTYSNINSLAWGIGWVFNENAHAKHMSVSEGSVFLLNPVDEDGNLKYFVTDQASQKRMMAYAKHEVAHALERMHNETFANALTMIDANYDEREVYKRMRALSI